MLLKIAWFYLTLKIRLWIKNLIYDKKYAFWLKFRFLMKTFRFFDQQFRYLIKIRLFFPKKSKNRMLLWIASWAYIKVFSTLAIVAKTRILAITRIKIKIRFSLTLNSDSFSWSSTMDSLTTVAIEATFWHDFFKKYIDQKSMFPEDAVF